MELLGKDIKPGQVFRFVPGGSLNFILCTARDEETYWCGRDRNLYPCRKVSVANGNVRLMPHPLEPDLKFKDLKSGDCFVWANLQEYAPIIRFDPDQVGVEWKHLPAVPTGWLIEEIPYYSGNHKFLEAPIIRIPRWDESELKIPPKQKVARMAYTEVSAVSIPAVPGGSALKYEPKTKVVLSNPMTISPEVYRRLIAEYTPKIDPIQASMLAPLKHSDKPAYVYDKSLGSVFYMDYKYISDDEIVMSNAKRRDQAAWRILKTFAGDNTAKTYGVDMNEIRKQHATISQACSANVEVASQLRRILNIFAKIELNEKIDGLTKEQIYKVYVENMREGEPLSSPTAVINKSAGVGHLKTVYVRLPPMKLTEDQLVVARYMWSQELKKTKKSADEKVRCQVVVDYNEED